MNDDRTDPVYGVPASQLSTSASPAQAADLPASARQLLRSLAHLSIGGFLLWAVAVAVSLAQSL
jgi:uncharacterized membrane protein